MAEAELYRSVFHRTTRKLPAMQNNLAVKER